MRSKERVSLEILLHVLDYCQAASLQVVSAEQGSSSLAVGGQSASCAQRGVDGWRDGEKAGWRDGFLASNRA